MIEELGASALNKCGRGFKKMAASIRPCGQGAFPRERWEGGAHSERTE